MKGDSFNRSYYYVLGKYTPYKYLGPDPLGLSNVSVTGLQGISLPR